MQHLEFPVESADEGRRVDAVLRRRGISGTLIRSAKRRPRGLLLDGEEIYTSYPVHTGQVVAIRVDDKNPSVIEPFDAPVDICYEDSDLLVVNKPYGLTVHPCAADWKDSVGSRLVAYYRKIGLEAEFHPVHRLDKGTSGLMVVAKHAAAQHVLTTALHSGDFHREYLAVCEGIPELASGWIDAPLGHAEDSYIRQCVRPDGKPARTYYEILYTGKTRALLRLILETGRTHQIRVHMAYIGHPLTGDFLYGTELANRENSRPALHSARLELTQPFSRNRLTFGVAPPDDFCTLLAENA